MSLAGRTRGLCAALRDSQLRLPAPHDRRPPDRSRCEHTIMLMSRSYPSHLLPEQHGFSTPRDSGAQADDVFYRHAMPLLNIYGSGRKKLLCARKACPDAKRTGADIEGQRGGNTGLLELAGALGEVPCPVAELEREDRVLPAARQQSEG